MKRRFLVWLLAIAMLFVLVAMPTTVANAENATGNVIVSVPWELINKCGHQAVSGPCQAYCWAYCRIILDNKSHTYRDYWTRYQDSYGQWHEAAASPSVAGYVSQTANMTSKQVLLKTICDNVDQGRPVVVRVKGSKAFHYVTAIGYRAGCDKNNLTEGDILILDPASKTIQATAWSKETYTYLSSCTLSLTNDSKYVCWTTESKGTDTETKPGSSDPITQAGKASKPVVSVGGTKAMISWSYSGTFTSYDVYLVQTPWRWEDIKYHASTTSTSCVFQNVAPGDYQAFIIVRPNKDTEQSEWTAFTVQPANPKDVKITFDANGGNASLSSKTISTGSYLTGLPTATRSGYTFLGWTMDRIDPNSSMTQTVVVISENMYSFDKDTTLYAYWKKNETSPTVCTVTFNASGGSVSQASKTVTSGSTYGTLPTPTKTGYTFDGWYTSRSGGTQVTASSTFNGSSNVTLYAHWTSVPVSTETYVTITFDANGGSTSQKSKTIRAGSDLTGLPTATRSGYTFLGWAVDKIDPNASGTYTTVVVSEGMFSFDKDTTLYAYWRLDKQTTPENCIHTKGKLQYSDRTHPHYNYYNCSKCGETFTDYSTTADISCESCWGPWSGWSTTPAYASTTRQVDTRSVQISSGATEYRYGRYIDSTGGHICWCSTYLGSKGYSGITVQYSSWSTTRYGANGKVWTCGNCNGIHTGIDHYDSQGRPAWKEYSLSSGSYYWEESRQTSASYETQYRYRDLIS